MTVATASRAVFFVLLAAVYSCDQPATPTELVVTIDAEEGVRTVTKTLSIEVAGEPDETVALNQSIGSPHWPVKIAVVPKGGDAGRQFQLSAKAEDGDGNSLALVRLVTGFVRGEKRYAVLVLEQACLGKASLCDVIDTTCHAGDCTPSRIDPMTLPTRPTIPQVAAPDAGSIVVPDTGAGDACIAREETCNGLDDDCNGIVDDPAPSVLAECKGRVLHATSVCRLGSCVPAGNCDSGFFDCDGQTENGCESNCPCAGCPVAPECTSGETRCNQSTPQGCVKGRWTDSPACVGSTPVCLAGVCVDCTPDSAPKRCTDNAPTYCDATGHWHAVDAGPCSGKNSHCLNGACVACAPSTTPSSCANNVPMYCSPAGSLMPVGTGACAGAAPVCLAGQCAECDPGIAAPACKPMGNQIQQCSAQGSWNVVTDCSASQAICRNSECQAIASCVGLAPNCGVSASDSCCSSPPVVGGNYTAGGGHVDAFRLDAYEVTVARLRAFVAAGYGTQAKPPDNNTGTTQKLLQGWQSAWNTNLAADTNTLKTNLASCGAMATWTDVAMGNERRPANCIDFYTAFAFCVWDGGFLPDETQWTYVARAGDQDRLYPWSSPADSTTIDPTYASYGDGMQCYGTGNTLHTCTIADIVEVGSKPNGRSVSMQFDMAGNVWEWTWDASPPTEPLFNGGAYASDAQGLQHVPGNTVSTPLTFRAEWLGFRCARSN